MKGGKKDKKTDKSEKKTDKGDTEMVTDVDVGDEDEKESDIINDYKVVCSRDDEYQFGRRDCLGVVNLKENMIEFKYHTNVRTNVYFNCWLKSGLGFKDAGNFLNAMETRAIREFFVRKKKIN